MDDALSRSDGRKVLGTNLSSGRTAGWRAARTSQPERRRSDRTIQVMRQLVAIALGTCWQGAFPQDNARRGLFSITCPGEVRPNPSFKRSTNGKAPGPRPGVVYHPARGPGALPLVPA